MTGKTDVSKDVRDRIKSFNNKQHSCSYYLKKKGGVSKDENVSFKSEYEKSDYRVEL